MTALRILHLYPAELGINGDRGNVLALRRRLEWRGTPVEVVELGIGEKLPSSVDLVHIGSGPRSARDAVLPDLLGRAARLREWADAGVPMIAVGAGFHLLGHSIAPLDGPPRPALGLLPVTVRDVRTRSVGEVLGLPGAGHRLAGFVNHGVAVELQDAEPLVVLDRGDGNAGAESAQRGRAEGVRAGALIGTHLHGPVLPMNPVLADELLSLALARRGAVLPEAEERIRRVDEYARRSRAAIAGRLGRAGVDV